MTDLYELVKKYVLINATGHGGTAQPKSVLGKLLADNPDMRSRVLELRSEIERTADEVNSWDLQKQKSELDKLGGYEPEKKIEKKGLPDLDLEREGFVVRFAPNPDGALHIGNARPAILSDEYRKKYRGKLILRFDDTDPKVKVPEKQFYKWIKDDLRWLKVKWDKEIIASKRLNLYYKYATELVKNGHAYVCTCDADKWKALRDKGKACDCRSADAKTNMRKWKKMLAANTSNPSYKEGEAVLRIKTELDAKNPAVRDWAAFRIVDNPKHPLVKKKLWPLYNFASAIDDHLLKVTHIMRGQEHSTNEAKQRYIYQYFGWEYPYVVTLGRFSLSDMVLSKSKIREGIKDGSYTGWDDPRVGTLIALRRRGFQPDALRQIIIDIGPKPSDITISSENLAAYNRRIVDKTANRYFFIPDPKLIEIKGMPIKKAKIPLHPEVKKGFRKFSLGRQFYVDSKDFDKYKNLEVRLKDLCNIKLENVSKYEGTELKPLPKIQWVPSKCIEVRVIAANTEIKGYGEPSISKAKIGSVVQFERFGFVRIEKASKNNVVAIFGHE